MVGMTLTRDCKAVIFIADGLIRLRLPLKAGRLLSSLMQPRLRSSLAFYTSWLFTLASATLFAAWILSGFYRCSFTRERFIATIEAGRLTTYRPLKSTPLYPLALNIQSRPKITQSGISHIDTRFFSSECAWVASDPEARWRWGIAWQPDAAHLFIPRSFALPLWLPFLATAVPAAFFFSPARSFLRRRAGLCPACTYDLRGLPAQSQCPECGHAPSSRRTTTASRDGAPSPRLNHGSTDSLGADRPPPLPGSPNSPAASDPTPPAPAPK